MLLIEKAWAKLSGTYLNSEAGLTSEALEHFTGMPTCIISEKDDVWKDYAALTKIIIDANINEYNLTCASG